MNWRLTTIIVVTAIPVIAVAFILFQHALEEEVQVDEKCETGENCVRFCCDGEDKAMCEVEENEIKSHIAEYFTHNVSYRVIKGNPCKDIFPYFFNEINISEIGHIIESENTYHWNEYCINITEHETTVSICAPDSFLMKIQSLYIYFISASLPFFIVTLAVYIFIRDLRNLHGKCFIAYVSSLSIMYSTLIFNGLGLQEFHINHNIVCKTIGYTFLTSVLCCFFWLNVMCYDIYRTFKKGIKIEENIQFLKYCGYAFGIPVGISLINFILNNFELIPDAINNGIGNETCSIPSNEIHLLWFYIYGPIALFLTINIIFYGITAYKIFRVQMETSKVCKSENSRKISKCSDSNDNQTRFFLYMRLSIVMGVPWIFEILSFIHEDSAILFIMSIFNCMQGFVVFITFVWNPKVTKQLKKRYTAMSVSYKKHQLSIKRESAKGESVKCDSVKTTLTKDKRITSESSAQV